MLLVLISFSLLVLGVPVGEVRLHGLLGVLALGVTFPVAKPLAINTFGPGLELLLIVLGHRSWRNSGLRTGTSWRCP